VLSPDTTLVLLSAGGNDAGFSDTVTGCAIGDCANQATEDSVRKKVSDAQASVSRLIAAIHERAPNATVTLVGYPKLFADYHDTSCAYTRISSSEMDMLNRLAMVMRDDQESTVEKARAAGIDALYVDMVQGFQDHGTCRRYDTGHDVVVPDDMNGVVIGPNGEGDFREMKGVSLESCVSWLEVGATKCIRRSSSTRIRQARQRTAARLNSD
jgi:hypothetical protein